VARDLFLPLMLAFFFEGTFTACRVSA
jgi:hypothetical protein